VSRPGEDDETPERLYVITDGRSRPTPGHDGRLDLLALVAADDTPAPGEQVEHARILQLCRTPVAVVEIAGQLRVPVGVARILLADLLTDKRITVYPPRSPRPSGPAAGTSAHGRADQAETAFLKKVLLALHNI
jgi:hypothetical protein